MINLLNKTFDFKGTLVFQNRNIYKISLFKRIMEITLFRQALGDTPKLRILEILLEGRELDYSLSDIARNAEIGRTTLFRIFDDLLKTKMIIPTRQIGNAKLFKINLENPAVKKLAELFDEIVLPKQKVVV